MLLNLPFTSLRAFEAVVRNANFSAAADELGISQSAVSQHVKALEEWVGVVLMVRGARRSRPTADGTALARAIADGLGQISETCTDLRNRQSEGRPLVICCPPGFAFLWLFPRLLEFDLAHPDVPVSIMTDNGNTRALPEGADIGIRYGTGRHPGLRVSHLMSENVFPVCAPALIGSAQLPFAAADLTRHTLLIDEIADEGGTPPTWSFWSDATGIVLPKRPRTRSFAQSNLVVHAAIAGLGIALGREPLVIDALQKGQLVRPFQQIVQSQFSYWIVHAPITSGQQKMQFFIDWVMSTAAHPVALPDA